MSNTQQAGDESRCREYVSVLLLLQYYNAIFMAVLSSIANGIAILQIFITECDTAKLSRALIAIFSSIAFVAKNDKYLFRLFFKCFV